MNLIKPCATFFGRIPESSEGEALEWGVSLIPPGNDEECHLPTPDPPSGLRRVSPEGLMNRRSRIGDLSS